jgi:hypothetical protein
LNPREKYIQGFGGKPEREKKDIGKTKGVDGRMVVKRIL